MGRDFDLLISELRSFQTTAILYRIEFSVITRFVTGFTITGT
jgi:hypothetical protein